MHNKDVRKKSYDIKKIIILGHSGFIGSHLLRAFSRLLPQVQVIGRSFPGLDLTQPASVEELKSLFNQNTVVVMCSAIKRQFGDDLDIYEKNISMCINLGRAIEASPVARMIFFSSMAVYGEDINDLAISESTTICPRSYYGLAKYTGEQIFERVFSRQKGSLVSIRPPLIYGFGDNGSTYGPVGFLKAAIDGRAITLWGDGKELREFVYIDDVADIVTRLIISRHCGIVNVTAGQSYSFQDILDIISRLFPQGIQVNSRLRSKNKVDNIAVNNRLREWLSGFKFTPLEVGIKKMYALEQACVGS